MTIYLLRLALSLVLTLRSGASSDQPPAGPIIGGVIGGARSITN